jgi:DNA-binding CsgD family transcriptional regulator
MLNPGGTRVAERGGPGAVGEVPFRDILDGDADRGVAIYDPSLRMVYANASARGLLHDPDGHATASLLQALQTFRDRVERSETAPAPGEILLGVEAGRRARATIANLNRSGQRWFIVRLSPPGLFAEPSVRSLQTRFLLTLRESQVALAVAKGQTNAEVAGQLGITEKTVKNALMSVFAKCKVRNRVELALCAHDVRFDRR